MVLMASLGMEYFLNCEHRSPGEAAALELLKDTLETKNRLSRPLGHPETRPLRSPMISSLARLSPPINNKYGADMNPAEVRRAQMVTFLSFQSPAYFSIPSLVALAGTSTSVSQGPPQLSADRAAKNPGFYAKTWGPGSSAISSPREFYRFICVCLCCFHSRVGRGIRPYALCPWVHHVPITSHCSGAPLAFLPYPNPGDLSLFFSLSPF